MPTGQLSRGPTAHVDAQITNAQPDAAFDRDETGRATGRLAIYGPGEA
jgi:hypothetical protein